jgi:hypothetical protein
MQAKILRGKYCAQDYGGQPFRETQKSIARDVMYARGLVNSI